VRDAPIRQQVRQPRALRDFGVRAVTAVLMGAVMIAADVWGGVAVWALVVAAIAAVCAVEFYAMMRTERKRSNEVFGVVAAAVMPIAAGVYATRMLQGTGASSSSELGAVGLTAVTGGLVLAVLLWNVAFSQVNATETMTTTFGALYAGFTLSHLVLLRAFDSGAELVLITLVSVWAMDVLAYLVGSAIGTHALAPHISPKKSWEGFIAGTIGTVAVWGVGWLFIPRTASGASPFPLWWFLVTGLAVAVAAVLGDLAESRLKREVHLKDSGRLLPGHGGFLDRFDSMIVVAVVVYYMMLFGGAR
jgi:phosphatidate cytidylyltransferase